MSNSSNNMPKHVRVKRGGNNSNKSTKCYESNMNTIYTVIREENDEDGFGGTYYCLGGYAFWKEYCVEVEIEVNEE